MVKYNVSRSVVKQTHLEDVHQRALCPKWSQCSRFLWITSAVFSLNIGRISRIALRICHLYPKISEKIGLRLRNPKVSFNSLSIQIYEQSIFTYTDTLMFKWYPRMSDVTFQYFSENKKRFNAICKFYWFVFQNLWWRQAVADRGACPSLICPALWTLSPHFHLKSLVARRVSSRLLVVRVISLHV